MKREREENKKVIQLNRATFANPKSASFTDPLASTNILEHLISLENWKRKRKNLAQWKSTYYSNCRKQVFKWSFHVLIQTSTLMTMICLLFPKKLNLHKDPILVKEVGVCVYTYTGMYVCMHVYIFIYIYIYITKN